VIVKCDLIFTRRLHAIASPWATEALWKQLLYVGWKLLEAFWGLSAAP